MRITYNHSGSLNEIGEVGIVTEVGSVDCRVQVDGGLNCSNWSAFSEIEVIKDLFITTRITERMERHMSNGEYVSAVKWAEIAEMVKRLEEEE